MTSIRNDPQRGPVRQFLVLAGNTCLGTGLLLLGASLVGLISADSFAVGGESGWRIIGAVAVFGCIIAAVGYFDDECDN